MQSALNPRELRGQRSVARTAPILCNRMRHREILRGSPLGALKHSGHRGDIIQIRHIQRGLPVTSRQPSFTRTGGIHVSSAALSRSTPRSRSSNCGTSNQKSPRAAAAGLGKLAALLIGLLLSTPGVAGAATYTGNAVCAGCHERPAADWQNSHHDLAMQEVSADSVLGDFSNATFTYGGVTTTFSRQDDRFFVTTDNAQGALETYPVRYVFGVYPLQQYLLPMPGGRLQALTIAWDARPSAEGGQRWFHLYPEEQIIAGDPLHWTSGYFNWNTSCAECHSTDVQKRFDAHSDSFDTRFEQIDVGCEACHGPGGEHVKRATAGTLQPSETGFAMSLAERGEWRWPDKATIAERSEPLLSSQQIDTCGRCHARRGTLGHYHPGKPLLETHRPALIEEPLYWPDGQIRDEVYVYGSFIQSKMHQAGVVCTNCHNPHSNQLVAEGTAVCGQCHLATQYDTTEHHRHSAGSSGSACVACHMPSQIYMGVDARRDHSMRIPRPDLSLSTGSPNACNQCHRDQSVDWAYSALMDWGVRFPDRRNHPARAFHAAGRGDIRATPTLIATANNESAAGMLRASAIAHLGRLAPEHLMPSLSMWLSSEDPLIRLAAIEATAALPVEQRRGFLLPRTEDPMLANRMSIAQQLAEVSVAAQTAAEQRLKTLFAEYSSVQSQHLDMPSVLTQLSGFQLARGDVEAAKQGLLSSLEKNPQATAARINLADLYRTLDDDALAKTVLKEGIELNAEDAALWFSLGLLEVRRGDGGAALAALKKAAALETPPAYYHYVLAIALNDQGHSTEALETLGDIQREAPGQPSVLAALVQYSQSAGDTAAAARYRAELNATLQAAGWQ